MGLGLSATDRVGKSESIERWTDISFGLFIESVDNKTNIEKCQTYPSSLTEE